MSADGYTKRGNRNRSYLRLEVWQKGMELFVLVSELVNGNRAVDLKLRSQLVDATQSISANIAQGYSRQSINEYLQFLYVALGSLSEALTRMIGLHRTRVLPECGFERFDALHYEVENKLNSFMRALEQRRDAGNWQGRVAEESEPNDDLAIYLEGAERCDDACGVAFKYPSIQ